MKEQTQTNSAMGIPARKSHKPMWAFTYGEVRVHACIAAAILWIWMGLVLFTGTGYRSYTGRLKGTDFIQFYTMGHLAHVGDVQSLYDMNSLHSAQVRLVPESAPEWYPPVYPPHTAVLFSIFARWSYFTAGIAWGLTTIALYIAVVWTAWHRSRTSLTDGWFVAAAAAAFPPFWNLILHGQTTVVPLVAFCLGWLALERERRFLAGLAFGLLAIKPQYGIVLGVIVVSQREWRLLSGAILSVAIQLGVTCLALDGSVVPTYVRVMQHLPQMPLLELHKMHSLRALTSLLPPAISGGVWVLLAGAVTWQAVRVWRTELPIALRMAVLVLASVLVSPHVAIYDATLLVLPLLWIGGWIEANAQRRMALRKTFWQSTYWLFVAFLVPTAILFWIQASVLLMVYLFVTITRELTRPEISTPAVGLPIEDKRQPALMHSVHPQRI